MSVIFPTGEPTSAQNFNSLLTNVAYKLGVAYYGSTGTGIPQPPQDAYNSTICATIINDAIRMLIDDGPRPTGWYWQQQIAQVDLWPEIGPDPSGSTYISSTGSTTDPVTGSTVFTFVLTTPSQIQPNVSTQYPLLQIPNFVQTMELRNIWLNGQPSTGTPGWFVPSSSPLASTSTVGLPFTVSTFIDPFHISAVGNWSSTLNSTNNKIPFSMAATGDYTMPANFGGTYCSEITWIANTNRGIFIDWVDEAAIRQQRQLYAQQFGIPQWAAVRQIPLPTVQIQAFNPPRPRWELMTFRITAEFLSVNFAYFLSFNNLVNGTDEPPIPLSFDNTLMAAIRAQAERYQMDSISGPEFQFYRTIALPNALKLNDMMAPKKLGYCGNPTRRIGPANLADWRSHGYLRPNVSVPTEPYLL
jgi:hypothetical protein